MNAFTKVAVVLVGCCAAAFPAIAEPRLPGLDWETFELDDYGVRLRYPSRLFEDEQESDTGDGRVFASRDGRAKLLIGVLDNRDRLSPREYQRQVHEESYRGADIDYSPVGRGWFVLSGTLDDKIFYEKVMFGCGGAKLASFAMVYPVEERRLYDAVVEHIENSFGWSSDEACEEPR